MPSDSNPTQSQTVTLPAADWHTILAGLYELPGKFGIPVIARLQGELHRMPIEEPEVNRGLGSLNGQDAAAAAAPGE
jgi:hypothetical protein